jgi:small subunit ribosomal protein S17
MNTKDSQKKVSQPKILKGVVVSNKMKDTVVVSVNRFVKHPRYKKYIERRKRYQAHDLGNTLSIGDKVTIVETKPISKMKRFRIITNEQSK